MRPLLLVGGGGHCRACIDVIEAAGTHGVTGIIQPPADGREPVLGYPVLGGDEDLPALLDRTPCALITVGQIKSPKIRIRLFGMLKNLKAELPVIQSPHAYCSSRATLGEGTILMHGSVMNANARVGENCIINSHALVEHDVEIGAHCHISTGAVINGSVRIGTGCFIGSGAVLREGIEIGDGAVIAAGQVVLGNVDAGTVVRFDRG